MYSESLKCLLYIASAGYRESYLLLIAARRIPHVCGAGSGCHLACRRCADRSPVALRKDYSALAEQGCWRVSIPVAAVNVIAEIIIARQLYETIGHVFTWCYYFAFRYGNDRLAAAV